MQYLWLLQMWYIFNGMNSPKYKEHCYKNFFFIFFLCFYWKERQTTLEDNIGVMPSHTSP